MLTENWFFLLIILLCIGIHFFGHGHGHGHGRHTEDHEPETGGKNGAEDGNSPDR